MTKRVDLFTYGVLMHSELLRALTEKTYIVQPATLHGFQRYALEKEGWPRVPVIIVADGSSVQGILVRDVDENSMEILDDFEDIDIGLYVKEEIEVINSDGQVLEAIAYAAGPESLDYLSGVWSPELFAEQHYVDYRDRIIPQFLSER